MRTITKEEFLKIPKDYRGIWSSEHIQEYIGKRTMLDLDKETGATVLLIEGFHFEIIE